LDNLLHWALLQTKQSYFNKESLRLFYCGTNGLQLQTTDAQNIHFENKVLKAIWLMPTRVVKIILRNLLDNAIKFSNQDGA
jgi:signal transduction histidine kinase